MKIAKIKGTYRNYIDGQTRNEEVELFVTQVNLRAYVGIIGKTFILGSLDSIHLKDFLNLDDERIWKAVRDTKIIENVEDFEAILANLINK